MKPLGSAFSYRLLGCFGAGNHQLLGAALRFVPDLRPSPPEHLFPRVGRNSPHSQLGHRLRYRPVMRWWALYKFAFLTPSKDTREVELIA